MLCSPACSLCDPKVGVAWQRGCGVHAALPGVCRDHCGHPPACGVVQAGQGAIQQARGATTVAARLAVPSWPPVHPSLGRSSIQWAPRSTMRACQTAGPSSTARTRWPGSPRWAGANWEGSRCGRAVRWRRFAAASHRRQHCPPVKSTGCDYSSRAMLPWPNNRAVVSSSAWPASKLTCPV